MQESETKKKKEKEAGTFGDLMYCIGISSIITKISFAVFVLASINYFFVEFDGGVILYWMLIALFFSATGYTIYKSFNAMKELENAQDIFLKTGLPFYISGFLTAFPAVFYIFDFYLEKNEFVVSFFLLSGAYFCFYAYEIALRYKAHRIKLF